MSGLWGNVNSALELLLEWKSLAEWEIEWERRRERERNGTQQQQRQRHHRHQNTATTERKGTTVGANDKNNKPSTVPNQADPNVAYLATHTLQCAGIGTGGPCKNKKKVPLRQSFYVCKSHTAQADWLQGRR